MSEVMNPATSEEEGEATEEGFWTDFLWLLGYAKPIWFLFACVLLFSLIASGSKSGLAFFVGPFFDHMANENLTMLIDLAIMVVCLAAISALGQYYFLYLSRLVREKIMVEMRTDVFGRLLDLPLSFYSEQKQGDLISRVTNDIQVSRQALHSILTKLLKAPIMAIVALGAAYWAAPVLTGIALLIAPAITIPVVIFSKKVKKYKKKGLFKLGDVVESINQVLSGIRVVRMFQAEDREEKEFRRENEQLLDRNVSVIQYKALSQSSLRLFMGGLIAIFLFAGSYLVIAEDPPIQKLSLGDLFQFVIALWMLYQPIKRLTKTYNKLQESLAGVRRIRQLLHDDHMKENVPQGDHELTGIDEGISIRDMSFAYDSQPVLKDINFDVNQGETLALVGPSGAGKSTLMDIIARFYHPQEGSISIDGRPVEEIDLTSFVDRMSIVSQDAYLFNMTIEENIRYGSPEASREEVEKASRMANIHDFIVSLDEGYETNVGERGVRLSGGQKQRITIARALLEDPELLLLDEATSDLDTQSEQEIQEAMEKLLEGRTCVIIAHRLSTIQNADQILVLDEGEIVQQGTHDQLIDQEGMYATLYKHQFSNNGDAG
jgi:subfamily B ATP-binding cassette protein MsbA